MKDEKGVSKGFGFVCFSDSNDAMRTCAMMKDQVLSQGMIVCQAKTKEKRLQELQKNTFLFKRSMQYLNLFVKGIEPGTTKEEVESFFSEYGVIKSLKVLPEAGRAFVCFEDRS